MANRPSTEDINHPSTLLIRHPSTLDTNHPGASGATNHPSGFNGNFAQLFAGFVGAGNVLQSVQSDLGITYGGTMLDTGGTGPVLTFTGTLTGSPVPIWVKCTLAGVLGVWTYAIHYDGTGTTPAMTGTSAATVTLTGAGAGLTLNVAAGAATLNNIWKATCSAWADQSGNALHYSQATATKQPIIGIGVGGKSELIFDGVDDEMSSALTRPAPGTAATFIWVLAQITAAGSVVNAKPFAGQGSLSQFMPSAPGSNAISRYAGLIVVTGLTPANGTRYRWEVYYNGSASDYMKLGAASDTPSSAGTTAEGTAFWIGGVNGAQFCKCAHQAVVYLAALPTPAQLATASANAQIFSPGISV